MPATKQQLRRLIRLVAELKRNTYPNSVSFAKKLREDIRNPVDCSARTIERDIEFLKNELKAPIVYDYAQKGFYLTRKTWDLEGSVLSEELMTSTLLGARLAEDIMPEPLKSEIHDAVDQHLATNYSETLENTCIDALFFASGLKATIDPDIFRAVFDAWRQRQSIEFDYHAPNVPPSRRHFEPHLVSLHDGLWYTKGISLPGGESRSFAIHRMRDVRLTGKTFEIDKHMIEESRQHGLFKFPLIDDITLHCDASIAFALREYQEAQRLKVVDQPDGSVLVTLPPSPEYEVARWVLREAGKIRVVSPAWLREKIFDSARKVMERNA